NSIAYYRLIVTCSGLSDTTDAIQLNAFTSALAANYTIDKNLPNSLTNFQSTNKAVSNMGYIGVSGPVNFRLANDTFTEQVYISAITGASAGNTIRFVGNNTVVKFSPSVSADRYIFRLDGANYIILDSLTIEADESSTYGFPIHFLSG